MYLKCPVTFQENTCILIFCMYFTRIPNESRIHFGIHIRYIKIHVSWALPWCHTGYMITCQDTLGYMYLGFFITIHQDTPGYKIKIHVSDTKATCGIHAGYIRDTCGIHVSSVAIKIQSRYILDPCKIHAGYMRDTYLGGWGNVLLPSSCAAHL